jgi:hypothetical protein
MLSVNVRQLLWMPFVASKDACVGGTCRFAQPIYDTSHGTHH